MGSLTKWIATAVTAVTDPNREQRIQGLVRNLQRELGECYKKNVPFVPERVFGEGNSRCSASDIAETKRRVYHETLTRIWKDGVVTEKEQHALSWAARVLELKPNVARSMHEEFAKEHFSIALARAMEDGVLTPEESAELTAIATNVGMSMGEFARKFFRHEGEAFLRSIFLAYTADNRLSDREWKALINTMSKLGISRRDLLVAIEPHARHLVEHTLAEAKADGVISAQEERTLEWLLQVLEMPPQYASYVRNEIKLVRQWADIAEGRLPSEPYPHGVGIRSGEIVHLCAPAIWRQARQVRGELRTIDHDGLLVLTDNRLIFASATGSHELKYGRIVKYGGTARHFDVQAHGKPQYSYFLRGSPSDLHYAIFATAIGKAHQVITERPSKSLARHIPRDIRQRVWQKYGGQCAECGAQDYLEFDHIIPVAKGGSNSDANVQLLCRRCNLRKSDAI